MTSIDAYNIEERPRRQLYKPRIDEPTYESGSLSKKRRKSLPQHSGKFAAYFEKLDNLATNQGLSSGCSEPPSTIALAQARAILHQLGTEGLEPTRVVASADGGVAICFARGDKYSDIECFNTGEILGVVSNRRDRPAIWKVEPSAAGFAQTAARIRDFLSGASGTHDAQWATR